MGCFSSGINGLPWWLSGEESTCNAGDTNSIPGSERSTRGGQGNPLKYICQKSPHGQRIPVVTELDMPEAAERAHTVINVMGILVGIALNL